MQVVPLSNKNNAATTAVLQVSFFKADTLELIHAHSMPMHFREEGGASLHPSGHRFIAGGSDLWVRVFDFETGAELECHKGHHGPVREGGWMTGENLRLTCLPACPITHMCVCVCVFLCLSSYPGAVLEVLTSRVSLCYGQ